MSDKKCIFIFIDGFGLARKSNHNPIHHLSMPLCSKYLGCSLHKGDEIQQTNLLVKGIDACLGVDGVPQSATGQTALFTGKNASKVLGHHYPAFPTPRLRTLIKEHSFLKQLTQKGFLVTFANPFTQEYFDMVESGKRQHSASTLSMLAADLPFRTLDDLKDGMAVSWDITCDQMKGYVKEPLETLEPEQAAKHLLAISKTVDFVFFETFKTDLIGHRHDKKMAESFLQILDRFLAYVFNHHPNDVSVLITSDHGNIEDCSHGAHTKNLVPLIVTNALVKKAQHINSLLDVTPTFIRFFD